MEVAIKKTRVNMPPQVVTFRHEDIEELINAVVLTIRQDTNSFNDDDGNVSKTPPSERKLRYNSDDDDDKHCNNSNFWKCCTDINVDSDCLRPKASVDIKTPVKVKFNGDINV